MSNSSQNRDESLHVGNSDGISVKILVRNMEFISVNIQELEDIKDDIRNGIRISWGLWLSSSIFCLLAGKILDAFLTKKNFIFTDYFTSLPSTIKIILFSSLISTLILSAMGINFSLRSNRIDRIVNQAKDQS
ncbi:MAG: hypothetical protein K2X50_01120 [Gammaproteobacteria bacterium]|nr:hypothetical protein [Gammaproteobacteria bacterium]